MTFRHTQLVRKHRESKGGDMDEALEMLGGDTSFYEEGQLSVEALHKFF